LILTICFILLLGLSGALDAMGIGTSSSDRDDGDYSWMEDPPPPRMAEDPPAEAAGANSETPRRLNQEEAPRQLNQEETEEVPARQPNQEEMEGTQAPVSMEIAFVVGEEGSLLPDPRRRAFKTILDPGGTAKELQQKLSDKKRELTKEKNLQEKRLMVPESKSRFRLSNGIAWHRLSLLQLTICLWYNSYVQSWVSATLTRN
jgi:hypothetical protein